MNELVTWIPIEREMVPKVLSLHYVVNQAPGDALNQDRAFSDWLRRVARRIISFRTTFRFSR